MGVYWILFEKILQLRDLNRSGEENLPYGLFLICGFWAWMALSSSLAKGTPIFIVNAPLIQKVYFPRIVLPVYVCLAELVNFLYGLAVLILFLAVSGNLDWHLLALPLVVLVHFIFILALTIFFSLIQVYFRDWEQVVNSLLTVWMFGSPVVYSLARVLNPDNGISPLLKQIYVLNPLVYLLGGFRWALLGGRGHDLEVSFNGIPLWIGLPATALVSLGLLALSLAVFDRHDREIVENV
jgi:lipopolysaccharide transport system permease protein